MAASAKRVQSGSGNGNGTTIQLTAPLSAPVAGNFLLAIIQARDALDTSVPALTPPAGWTAHNSIAGPANKARFAVYYKTAAAGDTNPQWTSDIAVDYNLHIVEYQDIDTGDPFDVNSVVENDNTSGTDTTPAMSGASAQAENVVVAAAGSPNGQNPAWTAPTTELFSTVQDNSYLSCADRDETVAGTYSATVSWSASSKASRALSCLKIAAVAPPTNAAESAGEGAHLDGFILTGATVGFLAQHANVKLTNCLIFGLSGTGVEVEQPGFEMYNCVLYGNGAKGIHIKLGATGAKIKHNTIYGSVEQGILVEASGAEVENNILRNNTGSDIDITDETVQAAANVLEDAAVASAGGTYNDSIPSPTLYSTDPLFVDAGSNDFRLQEASPAKDIALDVVAQAPELATDYDGSVRPQGSGGDSGAFEVIAASTATGFRITISIEMGQIRI